MEDNKIDKYNDMWNKMKFNKPKIDTSCVEEITYERAIQVMQRGNLIRVKNLNELRNLTKESESKGKEKWDRQSLKDIMESKDSGLFYNPSDYKFYKSDLETMNDIQEEVRRRQYYA